MRFFTLASLLLAAVSYAAPLASSDSLETRQIGDIQCNIARFKTVGALKKAQTAVKALAANATGTDAAAVGAASSALSSASAGIKTIASDLLTGQAAPGSARDQVGTGLKNALSALGNVTSVDTTDATTQINAALSAGADVVADCN